MPLSASIRSNLYKDSVALMRIAQVMLARPGVRRATLLMGTPANREILDGAGLARPELAAARPSDLMIVVEADSDAALAEAMEEADHALAGHAAPGNPGAQDERPARSLTLAFAHEPEAALAQISVPGPYAAAEALKALRQGMHVFLFSDNVPLEQERFIKSVARDKGLLVMGPDCGTTILDGVPIGFANVVRRGPISLVGASGTGLQAVSCQIDALGAGVRHVIGTGGRDVSAAVGGVTMCQAIDHLGRDAETRLIVLVSKPPAPEVARRVLDHVFATGKPCVVLFLGAELGTARLPAHVVPVATLDDGAKAAVALLSGQPFVASRVDAALDARAVIEAARLAPGQHALRGLYSGGTFCTEAQLVWREQGLSVASNEPLSPDAALTESEGAAGHVALDLGSDEYTVGRPHPMIDPAARLERLAADARDPAAAVIVLDVVLGYGAHDDPAGALAPAIAAARAASAREGRHLVVVAFVCGTQNDPQGFDAQQAKLAAAGAIVAAGSTEAARLAAGIAVRAAAAGERVRTGVVSR